MNITITINTENAAFCDTPEVETARILKEVSEIFESNGIYEFSIRDYNGNTVGKVKVEK